jgi:putative ABC transport system substrate-binding protein
MIRRRAVACGVALAAAAHAARAQTARVPRVGVVSERTETDPFAAAFRAGMTSLGYVDGRNVAFELRYMRGDIAAMPAIVDGLLAQGVDVLVVGGTDAALYAVSRTASVPVVFANAGDPVGSGVVAGLARPGGNATGMASIVADLGGKQLELLKDASPRLSRVGLVHNRVPFAPSFLEGAHKVAPALGLELRPIEVTRAEQIEAAFFSLAAARADGVVILAEPLMGNNLARLAALAMAGGMASTYSRREFAEVGGLIAFGPSFEDLWRRAATHVDKILKGARPGDLPVEQPATFELVINQRTAQALGLTVPHVLLLRADQVIE